MIAQHSYSRRIFDNTLIKAKCDHWWLIEIQKKRAVFAVGNMPRLSDTVDTKKVNLQRYDLAGNIWLRQNSSHFRGLIARRVVGTYSQLLCSYIHELKAFSQISPRSLSTNVCRDERDTIDWTISL